MTSACGLSEPSRGPPQPQAGWSKDSLRQLGCSCDWERTRFTLDDICARAVRQTFFNMFKDGLIFRGKRLVNWDAQLQTSVADDETYTEDVKGNFWTFKYPVKAESSPL